MAVIGRCTYRNASTNRIYSDDNIVRNPSVTTVPIVTAINNCLFIARPPVTYQLQLNDLCLFARAKGTQKRQSVPDVPVHYGLQSLVSNRTRVPQNLIDRQSANAQCVVPQIYRSDRNRFGLPSVIPFSLEGDQPWVSEKAHCSGCSAYRCRSSFS